MGSFHFPIFVFNHTDRRRATTIEKCLVDTGSKAAWVRREILESLGVKRERKDCAFQMANGQIVTRDIGYAIIQVGDCATIDEAVFAIDADQNLLGARSLKGLRYHP